MLADDHAFIDGDAGADEQGATIFQIHQGIRDAFAVAVGNQNTVAPVTDGPGNGGVFPEHPVHDAGAPGFGHEVAVISDQPARWRDEAQTDLATAGWAHVHQPPLALGDGLEHGAGELFVDIDHHVFIGLQGLPGVRIGAGEDPGPADGKLEALAAHGFYQHAHLQLAPSRDLEGLAALGIADTDGDIALGLGHEARPDQARGHLLARASDQGRIVDRKDHGEDRRVHRLGGDGVGVVEIAQGVGYGGGVEAGDGNDVAGPGLLDRGARYAPERQDLGDARPLHHPAIAVERLHRHVGPDRA